MSKRSNSSRDLDYNPDQDFGPSPKKQRKPSTPKIKSKTNEQAQTFLTTHAAEVVRMHKAGMKPSPIAKSLCISQGLREGAVTAKQVSNWIFYHKKAKTVKTRPVSGKNKNLRVDQSDQGCMSLFPILFPISV